MIETTPTPGHKQRESSKPAAAAPETPSPKAQAAVEAVWPTVTTLPNGLTVLTLKDDRFPLVSVRLYVRTGSANETPEQAGISHLLEHMVFKGSAARAPGQVAADVEGVGGYLNAATSFDYTVYYVDMPKEHWELGMDIVEDMAFESTIDAEELEREKKVVLSELERGEDNPSQLLFKTIQGQVWPGTTYARPIIGYRDTVEALSRQDILDYIAEHYQPQNMLLAVVGDVAEDDALAKAVELYGGRTNVSAVSPTPQFAMKAAAGPQVTVKPGDWNKVYLAAALPIPGLHHNAAAGLDVLAEMLGGDRSAKWPTRYKYKLRLVDDISVSAMTLERGGVVYISATLAPDKVDEFWATLSKDLAALSADDFAPGDFERAKLNLEDGLFRTKETLSGLASKVSYFQFFEGSQQAEANYLYNLNAVDAEEVQRLLDTYVRPEAFSAVLLTPAGSELGKQEPAETAAALTRTLAEAWPRQEAKQQADSAASGDVEILDVRGGQVVLTPDPTLPYAAISLTWPGGDDLQPKGKDGLAELTSRVLTKGAGQRSATDIQRFLSERASSLGVSAGRDTFRVSARYPQRFEADVLGLLRETLLDPTLAEGEIARGVEEQQAAIKSREDQPLGLAFRKVFPFLFNGGYDRLHLGMPENLPSLDADKIRDFWRAQAKRPFVLSACGVFSREAVLELADTLAKELDAGTKDYDYPAPSFGQDKELALHLSGRNQTHLVRIFPVPGSRHADAAGLELLKTALAGQSGRLFRDLRDKQGLGYSVTAFLWQAPETGFLAFYIGTAPDGRAAALAGFDTAVEELRAAPLEAGEMDRAKNLMTAEYYRENQTLASRAAEAAGLLTEGFALTHNRDVIDKAKVLSADDLLRLAREYLVLEESYLVSVDP